MTLIHMNDLATLKRAYASIDFIPVPIFVLSVEEEKLFRFESLNKAYIHEVGLRLETVKGKTPHECFDPRVADTVVQNYRKCIDTRTLYSYHEILNLNEQEVYWHTQLTPIFSEDGSERIVGIIGIAYDETRAMLNEMQLSQNLKASNRVNQDLAVSASTIAHDLRAPLRQVSKISELVMKDFEDLGDNKLQLIQKANEISKKSMAKVDEIVLKVKQLRDENTISDEKVDFGKWCLEIAALLDPLKKHDFYYPSVTIVCEKFILDVVLRNLMDNAFKHAKSEVTVDVCSVGQNLQFKITDDGEGFIDTSIENIRVNSIATGNNGSSGNGLINCLDVIESRDGEFWIDDGEKNKTGATVFFKISGKELNDQNKYYFMRGE